MARQIDLNQPLSPEDRAYLLRRGRGVQVRVNERRFGKPDSVETEPAPEPGEQSGSGSVELEPEQAAPEAGGQDSPEDLEFVNGLTSEELRDQLRDRALTTGGNKSELRQRLLEALRQE